MVYRIRVIGVQSKPTEQAKLFYVSDSMQDWLGSRADAAIYYSLENAKCAINQSIESIKQELNIDYNCELKEIQIVQEVISESVIQTLKPSEI